MTVNYYDELNLFGNRSEIILRFLNPNEQQMDLLNNYVQKATPTIATSETFKRNKGIIQLQIPTAERLLFPSPVKPLQMIINASPRFPAFVSLTIHAQAQKFFLAYALFIIALVKSQTVEKSYHFLHARFLERSKLLWAYKEATSFPAHLIPESMVLDRRWVCENGDYRDGDS